MRIFGLYPFTSPLWQSGGRRDLPASDTAEFPKSPPPPLFQRGGNAFWGFICVLFSFTAHAEEMYFIQSVPEVCRSQARDDDHWVDRTEEYLSERVCRAAVWFDSFFMDEREQAENADRFIRLFNVWEMQDGQLLDWRLRLNARIELPGLQHKFNLIISDEDEKDLTQTISEDAAAFTPSAAAAEETKDADKNLGEAHSLALRWNVVQTPDQSFSMRLKFRLSNFPTPALIGRYRYTHGLGQKTLGRFTQTAFWTEHDGIGETSRIDLERLVADQMLLRWSNSATFSESSRGVDWGTGLSLKHSLSHKHALDYSATIEGITRPNTHITRYRLGVRYRRNIFRPWLFIEAEPAMIWPEDEAGRFHRDTVFTVRLEAHFGRKSY